MKYMSDFIIYLYNMKVKELIEKLKELDQDREIYYVNREYGDSEKIEEIRQNCIFTFKCKEAWTNYEKWTIFYEEGYDNYKRRKEEEDGIVEYKETYLIE